MKKVLIIGIDSATFDIILPMIEEGKLRHLSSLINCGSRGILKSTIPPVTPPAWVSFMTGKNPGKHGVFDFYVSPSYGYSRTVWNSKYIKAKTIWKILSEVGRKVGVVNLPMTYPAEKINGFIIPGLQYSLNKNGNFSYPPELMEEVEELFGEYRVSYGNIESLFGNDLDTFLKEWREIFEVRRRTLLHLIENKKWDVFMAVFYSIDAIQHHFWKFFDKEHHLYNPALSEKYKDIIPEFYEKIDSVIGELLARIDKYTIVIVLSDHGAGPEKEAFYINNWLHENGFLAFKKRVSIPLNKIKTLGKVIDPREGLDIPFFINWKETRAYAGNHTEQGIYINLKGREQLGIVKPGNEYEEIRNSIIKKLKKLRDPETGNALEMKIYKKEEVYHGPYLNDAPDLFVEIKGLECLVQKEIYHKSFFGIPNKTSGTHRKNGILILKGKYIKENCYIKNANIVDIAPTILYSLGIPVPEDMDGRVLDEAFTEEYLENNMFTHGPSSSLKVQRGDGIFNEEEAEEIKKSLRNLGYL
jgi:predicted AlkP superfamily phosphohydrolase/phosphomutase